jgi:hypothetical protein
METVYYCSSIGGIKIIDATVLETGNNVLTWLYKQNREHS